LYQDDQKIIATFEDECIRTFQRLIPHLHHQKFIIRTEAIAKSYLLKSFLNHTLKISTRLSKSNIVRGIQMIKVIATFEDGCSGTFMRLMPPKIYGIKTQLIAISRL
jgi:hypothetical protein